VNRKYDVIVIRRADGTPRSIAVWVESDMGCASDRGRATIRWRTVWRSRLLASTHAIKLSKPKKVFLPRSRFFGRRPPVTLAPRRWETRARKWLELDLS
jgi:hypothetical protein